MKNYWKWILGIVIVLVVLFGLGIGSRLLMVNYLPHQTFDLDNYGFPMMGGRGFSPFGGMMHSGGGFMFLGWLVPLALVGLVVYGAYRLGTRKSPGSQAPLPPAAAPLRTCTKCGQQVEAGWNHCASCGKKL